MTISKEWYKKIDQIEQLTITGCNGILCVDCPLYEIKEMEHLCDYLEIDELTF